MDAQITVRPWHRRKDRSSLARWPAATIPERWSATSDSGDRQSWAIDRADELVGRITLRSFYENYSAELGIYLRPDCYGQGIGTAALREFIANVAPVHVIWLDVAPDNYRAITCYLRVGFRPAGNTKYGMIRMSIMTPLRKWKDLNASLRTVMPDLAAVDLD